MIPAKPSRTGMRSQLRIAYRPVYRAKTRQHWSARATNRLVARLRPGPRFWRRPPSPARLLCTLVRRILKFHETEPLLSGNDRCHSP